MIELPRLYRRIALYGLLLTPMLTAFASGQTPNVASKKIAQEARSISLQSLFRLPWSRRGSGRSRVAARRSYPIPGSPRFREKGHRFQQTSDSELMRRIASHDDSERMPPPKFADRLSEREQRILDTWIREGADLPEHWSFKPIQRPNLPAPEEFQQVRSAWHPIDRFISRQV